MNYRKFPRTGWSISEVGLGCWAIGSEWGNVNESDSITALKTAIDQGVNFFDTADVYGDGRSEKLIGKVLKTSSEKIYVATKSGRRLNPHTASGYNLKNIENFIDRSLFNLNTDSIDLLQLHCPPSDICDKKEIYEMMDFFVTKGKIKNYGVSVEKVSEALAAINFPNVKSIQIIFNIFRQKPLENFFFKASKKNVGIIVRVPLASGLLTGKMSLSSTFPENDHRNYNIKGEAFDIGETFSGVNFKKGLEAVRELKSILPDNFSLSNLALKWILMHPEVSVVIPGAKNDKQVIENVNSSKKEDIGFLMQKIENIYKKYFKIDIHKQW